MRSTGFTGPSDAAMAGWHYSFSVAVGGLEIVAAVGCSAGPSLCRSSRPMVLLGYGGEAKLQQQSCSWSLGSGQCLVVPACDPGSKAAAELVWSGGTYNVVMFGFDQLRFQETLRLMGGAQSFSGEDDRPLQDGNCWPLPPDPLADSLQIMLRELIEKTDRLLEISSLWLEKLQLEDQIYRHLVGMLFPDLGQAGVLERLRQRGRQGRDAFDELIDYIQSHLDQPLNLTLLASRSHYSRRALQYAFRERLGCTPTQWIRNQRLDLARTLLERPRPGDSVSSIAMAAGYRSLSLFSVDFQQRFHLKPSDLLREARASSPQGC